MLRQISAARHIRRSLTAAAIGAAIVVGTMWWGTPAQATSEMTVFKSPYCGCCGAWIEHMERAGFTVRVRDAEDLDPVKKAFNIPDSMQSCHTATVDGYVIEGHVPVSAVQRMLDEKPDARGIAVPGMPMGSPGMEQGGQVDPYDVILMGKDGRFSVYESHR